MTSSYLHCSGFGSWVVDREFVIWVSPCSMVVIRWVLPCSMVIIRWVSPCSMVVIRGSRIRDMVSLCWFRWARWRDMVLGWLCSVVLVCGWLVCRGAGGCFGFWVGVIWCWVAVLLWCWFLGSAMEGQRWETETRDERQRRESQIKYYYFFTIIATVQFYV